MIMAKTPQTAEAKAPTVNDALFDELAGLTQRGFERFSSEKFLRG